MPLPGKKHSLEIRSESMVERFEPDDVTPTPKQVARYIGGSKYKLDGMIKGQTIAAIDHGLHLTAPKMVYAVYPVKGISESGILCLENGSSLTMPPGELVSQTSYLVAVICTLGSALEQMCHRLSVKRELLEAVILDAVGVAMLEALSDKTYDLIGELAGRNKLYTGCRIGPGISGMDISNQFVLFSLAKGAKIGVRLNKKSVMIPNKSVSFFVGLTKDKSARRHVYKCQLCPRIDCQFRITSYFPSGNGPFSDELRSPRAYFLDVRSVRLVVNPCAGLLIEKIAHFQIGN
jgi:hypothetical protein